MNSLDSLNALFGSDVAVRDGRLTVSRASAVASPAMDRLVRAAVFGDGDEKEHARWMIWELGQAVVKDPNGSVFLRQGIWVP